MEVLRSVTDMPSPLVSVIIPVYNASQFIRKTLLSVFDQTLQDLELICVDDGSSDNSLGIISEISHEFDRPIVTLRQSNAGCAAARNYGARHASGRYLAFLDQDDVWYPQKLELQMSVLERDSHVVLVHCDCNEVDENGKVLQAQGAQTARRTAGKSWVSQLLGPQGWILPSLTMVRHDTFTRIGGFDAALRCSNEDADLTLRMREQGKIVFLDVVLVDHLIYEKSYIEPKQLAEQQHQGGVRFYQKLEAKYANDSAKLHLVRLLLASKYSDRGWHRVTCGNRRQGLPLLFRALSYDPKRFRTYARVVRAILPLRVFHGTTKR